MDLILKLKEGYTLRDVALEIQQINTYLMAQTVTETVNGETITRPLMLYGPLQCNPDSECPEGFLGSVNTPPNEYGFVTIRIENYESLEMELPAMPLTFVIVMGYPRRGENNDILPGAIL